MKFCLEIGRAHLISMVVINMVKILQISYKFSIKNDRHHDYFHMVTKIITSSGTSAHVCLQFTP